MTDDAPAAGKFVRQTAPEYRGTHVYHALYLPVNWRAGETYPVIVEYAPNKWAELTGKVEDCRLGFHQSGGSNFIWVVFPYVDPIKKENVVWWWGNEDATLEYCLTNLRRSCEQYGGDPNAVLFTGFSRGAIAAGYLALRNDSIADVWLGFLPHSHIDGGRFTPNGARERLARTRGRPTFVTYGSDDDGKNESPKGARILRELGFPVVERELPGLKHTDRFLDQDCPIRREMRDWIADVLKNRPGTWTVSGRVVDRSGKGIAGVRVQCGSWHWSVTDTEGRYRIASLVQGRRPLVATKTGWQFTPAQSEITIAGQDIDVEPLTGTVSPTESSEEFIGPYSSWADVKRDFGAVGDGKADDTAALQKALDTLTKHTSFCVLYLPAGTYRITGTLKTIRKAHTDCQGVAVVGEDPAHTVLRWDGPASGTMLQWDAWYSRNSRLTFDGAGRADVGLIYGPAFSTYNETSDLVFRDLTNGLVFGGPKTEGQAENAVLRCQFLRCGTGIQTVNWNSMDIWVWYGRFEDCGRGVHNVMGNWHVWESLFLRSRIADMSSINLMAFSANNNTSSGSRRFFDFSSGHSWGSPVSLTGNRVLDPTGDWAVILDNAGPYLVVDNQFRLTGTARGVRMTWADQTLVGNIYSTTNAVEERGRFRRVAEQVVAPDAIATTMPALPPPPPRRERKVFEIPKEADADTIQRAIDDAAKLAGQRPVVHLPMGNYKIAKTLVIPAGCDLQLIGDSAGETGSRLNWTGPNDGILLRVAGPSQATLRDFYIHAGGARALLVENCDQPHGRILADQLLANGPSSKGSTNAAAVRITGLDQTDVLLRSLQGSGNAGRWVEVSGGRDAAHAANQVSIFTGATGSAAGQYDVRSGGRLVVRSVYHERSNDSLNGLHLADRGTLSIDATRFSYATSPHAPTVAADDFRGLFTLATCMLMPVETKASCRFEMRGDGRDASVLALNNQFWIEQKTTADDVWRNLARPPARGGLIGCNVNTGKKEAAPTGFAFLANLGDQPDPAKSGWGAGPPENRGTVDDATLLRHLAPLRAARVWLPSTSLLTNTTDLRIHRVMADGGHGAVVEFSASR